MPLAEGNRWTLANAEGVEMQLTAQKVERIGPHLRVRLNVSAPFLQTTLIVRSYDGKGLWLEGTGSGENWNRYPEPAPFLPEAEVGVSNDWDGGSSTLLSSDATVAAWDAEYTGVRLYEVRFGEESPLHWFLKPGLGFVQFGLGAGAFTLRWATLNDLEPEVQSDAALACPLVGIEPNPIRDFSAPSRKATLESTVDLGTRFNMISVAWGEVEPKPGQYALEEIEEYVNWAEEFGLSASLTIKTLDTTGASLPPDLARRAWNDSEVIERFRALLAAVSEKLSDRIRWINLGNEVDVPLASNPEALAQFKEFYLAGKQKLGELRPELPVGLVFTYDSYRTNTAVFRALEDGVDHVAFTYYGVNPARAAGAPVHRHISNLPFDFADMLDAAAGRPLIFTELGRASSEQVGSSPREQAEFYGAVLDSIRTSGGRVAAASFSFYSDMPPLTAFLLSTVYGPQDAKTFMRWFGSLGVVDRKSAAKPAWEAYRSAATAMADGEGCR